MKKGTDQINVRSDRAGLQAYERAALGHERSRLQRLSSVHRVYDSLPVTLFWLARRELMCLLPVGSGADVDDQRHVEGRDTCHQSR